MTINTKSNHLMKFSVLVFTILFLSVWGKAQAQSPTPTPAKTGGGNLTIVAVGEATVEKEKIVILPVYLDGKISIKDNILVEEFRGLLVNDFAFYRKIFLVPDYSGLEKNIQSATTTPLSMSWPDYGYWGNKDARFLVSLMASSRLSSLEIKVWVHDIKARKEVLKKTVILGSGNLRQEGHTVANEIYKFITGKESIFKSRIVFVCDMNTLTHKEPIKELFISDFDGYNVDKLTNYRSTVISPSISNDKKSVVFSLITKGKTNRKNIDLFLMDMEKRTARPISTKKGINSGAVFMPSGDKIALTLSGMGNADIFIMDLNTNQLRRVTSHPSDDVDPSFSPDEKTMAFLSGRPGKAMIYTLDPSAEEKNVTRITYVGKFNATPRFSPDGKEIVFASWVDESFDIYRINIQGQELVRLTKDFGSNEDPSYSNDGQFIAFSSTRILSPTSTDKNVYIMDRDGEILGPITKNLGNCTTPYWSK